MKRRTFIKRAVILTGAITVGKGTMNPAIRSLPPGLTEDRLRQMTFVRCFFYGEDGETARSNALKFWVLLQPRPDLQRDLIQPDPELLDRMLEVNRLLYLKQKGGEKV